MIIFGAIVLVPVYYLGDNVDEDSTDRQGISNILNNPDDLVVSMVYSVVFSVMGYFLLYIVIKTVSNKAFASVKTNLEYSCV